MCDQPQSFKIWLLEVILLLGLLALFMWLGLRPKDPTYSILDLTVPVSNTTSSTANQTTPNGTLSFSLDINNSNQESSVFYDDILLMFNYNEEAIGDNKIPYFHQGKGNKSTKIKDRIDINARTLQKVMDAISNKGASLKVNLKTSIRYKTWGIRSKHHKMYMEGVVIVGSDGKIQGKKKKIKLKHAFKKWKRVNFS